MRKIRLPRWFSPEPPPPAGVPAPEEPLRLEDTAFFQSLNLKPTREVALPAERGGARRVIRYEGTAGDPMRAPFRIRLLALQAQEPGPATPRVLEYSLFLDKPTSGPLAKGRLERLRIFRGWAEMHAWPKEVVTRLLDQFNQAEREDFHVSQDPLLASHGIAVTSSATDTFLTWIKVS
jgi:hypothetical protein